LHKGQSRYRPWHPAEENSAQKKKCNGFRGSVAVWVLAPLAADGWFRMRRGFMLLALVLTHWCISSLGAGRDTVTVDIPVLPAGKQIAHG
jgi:hypothetical protein